MRKTKEFMVFGNKYRITQLAAAVAFDRISKGSDDFFPLLETATIDGVRLDTKEAINEKVKDSLDFIKPRLVLSSLVDVINDFNFGFFDKRKPPKLPNYMRSTSEDVPRHSDESPVIGLLVAEGKATLRELEEYYSLEDAFRLYDIIFIDKLNQAEVQYAISSKRR
jgi:hypothetical protein